MILEEKQNPNSMPENIINQLLIKLDMILFKIYF